MVTQRSASIEMAARVAALKASGKDVIDLSWGAPHLPPPEPLLEATAAAFRDTRRHSYGPARGLPVLRETIAGDLESRRGLRIDPHAELLVCPGGKQGAFVALRALLQPGDEVLIPEPYWLSYPALVELCGGVPVCIPTDCRQRYMASAEAMQARVTPRTRGIVLNSPNNPSGMVFTEADLDSMEEVISKLDFIITDEVYDRIIFDGRTHVSPFTRDALRDRCILVNSFSKTYAVPGWRLGYIAARADWIEAMLPIQQQTITCMPAFLQQGLADALEQCEPFIEEAVSTYQAVRDELVHGCARLGRVALVEPEGAFYALLDLADRFPSGDEAAAGLLDECGIATVTGRAYGSSTETCVRICFARPLQEIRRAVDRLDGWLA